MTKTFAAGLGTGSVGTVLGGRRRRPSAADVADAGLRARHGPEKIAAGGVGHPVAGMPVTKMRR